MHGAADAARQLAFSPPRLTGRGGLFPATARSGSPPMTATFRSSSRPTAAGRRGPRLLRALLALLAHALVSSAAAHPKPGAHADIRITVDADAVRFDMVMNILFADQLVRSRRTRSDEILDAEIPALRDAMSEYFGAGRSGSVPCILDRANRVTIDGLDVAPLIRTLRIIRPAPEIRPGFVQNPALLLPQIHVQLEYPIKTPPRSIGLLWGTYPRDFIRPDRDEAPISDVEAVLIADGSLEIITFRKAEPEHIWHAPAARGSRFAPVPQPAPPPPASHVAAVLLGGGGSACLLLAVTGALTRPMRSAPLRRGVNISLAVASVSLCGLSLGTWRSHAASNAMPPLTDEAVLAIFGPLHANIYRAFDYTRDAEIFDALARSVDGPLLDRVYDQIYRSLIMQEEGGALSRVKRVEMLDASVVASGDGQTTRSQSYGIRARWRVEGVVYHWGHAHERTNEYAAAYQVALRPSGWRVVGVEPLEQHRIQTPLQAGSGASATMPMESDQGVWKPQR